MRHRRPLRRPAGICHQGKLVGLMMPVTPQGLKDAAPGPLTPANLRQWLAQQPARPPSPFEGTGRRAVLPDQPSVAPSAAPQPVFKAGDGQL